MENKTPNLLTLLNKTSKIEELLTVASGTGFPWQRTTLKTIYDKPEFVVWKTQLKHQLQSMPQEPIILETIDLLNNGFKTGFSDERDFRELKAKLSIIAVQVDELGDNSVANASNENACLMRKGTTIKTAFDEYLLVEQVGSGGNGRVFSAINSHKESVAIKFVKRDIPSNKLKRFRNEIHFCEQHNHKNIVEIRDRGYVVLDNVEYIFYVMPLYAETLRNKIRVGLAHEEAVIIFTGLLEGLAYAHKCGTIHRDIKPENIMFRAGNLDPIICDFGIAHFAEEELLTVVETQKSDRMANFQYAAPEQRIKGGVATEQTDIYAAALILNEMFTAEIPQAAGYKTIESVAPEYRFLDDIFLQLFRQKPSDRLYPEERILSEMKVLAETYKRDQQKIHLQSVIHRLIDPDEFGAKIVKKEYRDGKLIFIFDCELPNDWYQYIAYGSYSCTYTLGYGHNSLIKVSDNELGMPLRKNETEQDLKSIVNCVEDWVHTANIHYNDEQKRKATEEQRRKETARKAEIERLEKDNAYATMIVNL